MTWSLADAAAGAALMAFDENPFRFRPGQRWLFYTGLDEFQRELVVLAAGRSAQRGDFFEVAVPFSPQWDQAPAGLDGALLAVGREGLEGSAVELVEEDLVAGDVRRQMRLPGQVHITEGTVDDGLRECLAAARWEAAQRRAAGQDNLLQAIEEGDLDAVRRILDENPAMVDAAPEKGDESNLPRSGPEGAAHKLDSSPFSGRERLRAEGPFPPLCAAVRQGRMDIAALLLDRGADANAAGSDGMTPLHYAAEYGLPEAAALLIGHGADVRRADAAGVTPILAAARSAEPDAFRVAQVLEDEGAEADLNTLVSLGWVGDALRRLEADPHACAAAPFPQELLDDAIRAVERAILRRSDPGVEDRPAIDGVMAEHLPLVERLLAEGADPNAGFALWAAAQLPDPRPARLLLARGADPNKDLDRGYFLPEVARNEAVRTLLREHGAKDRNDPELVVARETALLADDPEDAEAVRRRAAALGRLGRWAEALADWEQAVLLAPEDPEAYAARAWIWAACPDDQVRDGPSAVASARRAIELDGGADVLWDEQAGRAYVRTEYREALAAALAECGRFEEAVAAIDEALEVASPQDRPRLRYRRDLFASGSPYRDVPGADDPALYRPFEAEPSAKRPGVLSQLAGWLAGLWGRG